LCIQIEQNSSNCPREEAVYVKHADEDISEVKQQLLILAKNCLQGAVNILRDRLETLGNEITQGSAG